MVFVISGIKRSCSTVQFNIIRIAMKKAGYKVNVCGHDYKPREVPKGEIDLVKRHSFSRTIAESASHVFITDREDKDILQSLERFTGQKQNPDRLKKMRINLHLWRQYSDSNHYFHFNEWESKPLECVRRMIQALGVDVPPKEVLEEVNKLKPKSEYDPETCLFPNHITKQKN